MAEIQDLKKVRKSKKRKKALKRLLLFCLICVGVLAIFYFSVFINNVDVKTWAFSELSALTTKSEGFPIDLDSTNSKSIVRAGADIFVLTESNGKLITQSGKSLVNIQHGYQNPQAKAVNGKILLFDRGTVNYRMIGKSGNLYNLKTENPIITAAISQNGMAAIVTEAQMYASQMLVSDPKGKELFKWNSDGKSAVSVSFSYDEKKVATATVSAENGQLSTTVYVIEFDKASGNAKELNAVNFNSSMPLSIQYKADGRLSIIGDNMAANVDANGTITDSMSFNDSNLIYFDESDKNTTVLCFGDYSHFKNSEIVIIKESYNAPVKIPLNMTVKSIKAFDEKIYVLTSEDLRIYNYDGALESSVSIGTEIKDILPLNTNTYLLTPSQLRKL